MRRSIWTPVGVTILIWLAAAILPQAHPNTWRMPVAGEPWLAPPSWPVPALREHRFVWAGFELGTRSAWLAPSWPPVALRHFEHTRGPETAPRPLAAPLALARAATVWRTVLAGWCAAALALALLGAAIASARLLRGRLAHLTRIVTRLAERGVEHSHISRRAGLPRDAVRAMLRSPLPVRPRKRA